MSYALKFVIHLALVFSGFLLAYELRRGLRLEWWINDPQARLILGWAATYTLIAATVELMFRIERTSWRFSSAREVLKVARSTGATSLIFLLFMFIGTRANALPRSTVILAWIITLLGLVGVRLVWRLINDPALARSLVAMERIRLEGAAPLILIGDVEDAEAYLRRGAAGDRREYTPVAMVTRDGRRKGQLIHGVPIIGGVRALTSDIAQHLQQRAGENKPAVLFLQDPIGQLGLAAEQIGWLRAQHFRLLRQSRLIDLQAEGARQGLREIQIEEFLPRAPVQLDPTPLAALVANKRVLVTGAGGSIGSEIARQLVSLNCAHISLLDHSEFLLFEIDRELEVSQGSEYRSAVLCNVRERDRVFEVFQRERPDIVFHAAALKHVTLVENNPCEGALTNVMGTQNVAEATRACGASQMVLISTDKAVNPTNVMGATKRLAEAVLPVTGGDTKYCAVRFGNVLGSAGSVVPIFRDQIERGGPVTVTDERVERFFMTIPEAVQLVLHATAISSQGRRPGVRKFVLEMGQPVKIVELARQMIELSGRVPGVDVEIKITGLRPGEKMSEELVAYGENVSRCVPGINEIQAHLHEHLTDVEVARLSELAISGDAERLKSAIRETLATLKSGRESSSEPQLAVAE